MRPAIRSPTARTWWTSRRRSDAHPRRRPGPNLLCNTLKNWAPACAGDTAFQYTFIHEVLRVNTLAA